MVTVAFTEMKIEVEKHETKSIYQKRQHHNFIQ